MSVLNKLTEGIIHHDVRKETHALVRKWEKTGLLEGINSTHKRDTMVRLLENQARLLLKERSSMTAGDVEGFAAVAFPLVRRVFAGLIANDLVSVQAMNNSVGLIFFLDFVYSADLGDGGAASLQRLGNTQDKSIYGGDQVASQITGGVDLVNSLKGDLGGPRTTVGYAYGSPTGSMAANGTTVVAGGAAVRSAFKLDGDVSEARKKLIDYDPDLLSLTSHGVIVADFAASLFTNADYDNMGAFDCFPTTTVKTAVRGNLTSNAYMADLTANANIQQVRRLTRFIKADTGAADIAGKPALTSSGGSEGDLDVVRFFFVIDEQSKFSSESDTALAVGEAVSAGSIIHPIRDQYTTSNAIGSIIGGHQFGLEANANIPEIDIKIDSVEVRAITKKLKAKWTQELGQDLSAWHNVDAEVELTSVLAEHVALEIDREILADLIRGAKASTFYWSRSPGLFVNRTTGSELGAASAAPDFTGTVSEWYQTLIETINDVSAQIHRKTLRGGANFVVCSPEVANILEFTSAFRASVTHDAESGYLGVEKVGSLNRKMDVIVDPYFPRQIVLVGRRGKAFLESGYVYAPYVPLQTFPTIPHPEDFTPRMGVMTRYAKKMIRPDMYGLVVVRGLLGEEGGS
jgi:hypothetical protein